MTSSLLICYGFIVSYRTLDWTDLVGRPLGLPQLGEWSSATVLSLPKHNEEKKKKYSKVGGEWYLVRAEKGCGLMLLVLVLCGSGPTKYFVLSVVFFSTNLLLLWIIVSDKTFDWTDPTGRPPARASATG